MENISISLAKIIVFDFIIKQEASWAGMWAGVYFHSVFGNLVKSWLSRCELNQREKRLMPVLISGSFLFPTRPHLHQRTATVSRTLGGFQPLISLNIVGSMVAWAAQTSV